MAKRVVLAYSGGLDTSVAVRWMIEELGVEVIALAVDVGQASDDWDVVRGRAVAAGAIEAVVVDARQEFAEGKAEPWNFEEMLADAKREFEKNQKR